MLDASGSGRRCGEMNQPGCKVRILFKGILTDGTVFDECLGEPYEVKIGSGQVMEPLDRALAEMQQGEERVVEIAAKDAYGEYREDAVLMTPSNGIRDGDNVPVGEMVMWHYSPAANPVPAKVLSFDHGMIELDFNHPLAGRDLVYWVKLL